jgi:hypothetical protein
MYTARVTPSPSWKIAGYQQLSPNMIRGIEHPLRYPSSYSTPRVRDMVSEEPREFRGRAKAVSVSRMHMIHGCSDFWSNQGSRRNTVQMVIRRAESHGSLSRDCRSSTRQHRWLRSREVDGNVQYSLRGALHLSIEMAVPRMGRRCRSVKGSQGHGRRAFHRKCPTRLPPYAHPI